MRPPLYSSDALPDLFQRQSVATLSQVSAALGHCSLRTAVRRLAQIPHHTSYSHNGRFYALADRPQFDAHGLWSFQTVRFSSRGTLLDTAAALVRDAASGYRVEELDALLRVRTGDALRKLVARDRLAREQRHGRWWYAATDSAVRARQRTARQAIEDLEALPTATAPARGDPQDALQTFVGSLDERQRRWFAGLESLRRGHGGDRRAAALLGLHPRHGRPRAPRTAGQ